MLTGARMKVRAAMLVVEHRDHNPEKPGDLRHGRRRPLSQVRCRANVAQFLQRRLSDRRICVLAVLRRCNAYVQRLGCEIHVVGPRQRRELGMHEQLTKTVHVPEGLEDRSAQGGCEIDFTGPAIPESQPHDVIADVPSLNDVVVHLAVTMPSSAEWVKAIGSSGLPRRSAKRVGGSSTLMP